MDNASNNYLYLYKWIQSDAYFSISNISGSSIPQSKSSNAIDDIAKERKQSTSDRMSSDANLSTASIESKSNMSSSNTKSPVIKGKRWSSNELSTESILIVLNSLMIVNWLI